MKKDIIIFDLDGTLACTKDAYKGMDCPDTWSWRKFEDRMSNAPLIESVACIWHNLVGSTVYPVVLTARPYFLRKMTENYLKNNGLGNYLDIYMMGNYWFDLQESQRNTQKIHEVQAKYKKMTLDKINKKYNILMAIDDHKENIEMFKENNITSLLLVR